MIKLFTPALLLLAGTGFAQTVDPYLQAPGATSMAVSWKTAVNASPHIRLGTSPAALTTSISGGTQAMSDVGYTNNYFYHTVKLHGLTPATKYYYRAVSGNDSSAVSSFVTLPLPGAAPNASGHLRFLILGDNQIKSQPRYDSLMVAARRKLTQRFGPSFNDSVSVLLNMGDQVDVGTLDHYDNVHLKKSRYLSGMLPILTAVGNHETYGTLQMSAYYNHFVLDSLAYGGLYSGNEGYYSLQLGNMVVIYLNTEVNGTSQFNWLKSVVDAATADPGVKWIMTIGHRPYQAEQYVGDISTWMRNTVVPYCMQSPKYLMNVGAHHHIYARGQMKDVPCYNVISGGTAWDQYWGMATEQNFDDVQKTISNWAYQLVDVDMVNDEVKVETFSIGSIYKQWDNVLIDEFHRRLNVAAPTAPEIVHDYADSVQLPLTLTGSAFHSAGGELLNSTEFQISPTRNFSVNGTVSYRHYEDFFGNAGAPDTTIDQNRNVDITKYTVNAGTLGNGWHYVRLRHRDRNLSWSAWSATDSFKVYNSVIVNPQLSLDTNKFVTGQPVTVTYTNGPAPTTGAWIGIYRKGATPSSSSPSVAWQYVTSNNGTMTFNLTQPNEYYVAYFGTSGYTEVAPRKTFYYGPSVSLSTPATNYALGDAVPISFSNAPGLANDWIGVYKIGMTPGGPSSIKWSYVSGASGLYNVTGLGKGYYFASYMVRDGYTEAGPRIFFSVGDQITTLSTNKTVYNLGEYISATWVDGPGIPKDWLGVYQAGDDPNVDPLYSYTYIDGLPAGSKVLQDSAVPNQAGNYFLVLFTNDTYTEVSNRINFEVTSTPLAIHLEDFSGTQLSLNHLLRWKATGEGAADRYELQQSADGKHFATIYRTGVRFDAGGAYSYTNEQPAVGYNYYRLRMIAGDGKESYSRTIRLHENESGENPVRLYPNPTSAARRSVVESPYPIDQIEIVDAAGQLIYESKNINNNRFSLLHQELPAGTYFVRIHSRKLYTLKMVVN